MTPMNGSDPLAALYTLTVVLCAVTLACGLAEYGPVVIARVRAWRAHRIDQNWPSEGRGALR